MILWLWRLIWGRPACEHKWEEIECYPVYVSDEWGRIPKLPRYSQYILKCEKCGWLTSRKF